MSKKLEDRGLLEHSRMMLPEHKRRISNEELETLRRGQLILDAQKVEEIECTLALSLRTHVRVTVILYDPSGNKLLNGFVTSIHTHSREIKLQWAEEWKWINVDDIVEVYIV
ncbi:YolD-like family protein [Paenibacillus pedocola]|uniref:YolD-like family protein n=1 Tax=Paenibacillus pedocola TaxID=3242193 RepID=UPI00287788AF|nr:YolD-like family protein [Paenibacillus typhae]